MGLSKTSTSIGWVLVDGADAAAFPLDHDAFDLTDASAAAPAATARRVREIAIASGFTVDSVHVTSSGNVTSLRNALTECGFDDVVSVPLSEATRSWGRDTGYANAMEKTAICVLGRDSAALTMIETRSGATQSATSTVTADLRTFTSWLNFALGAEDPRPDVLYLIGSRAKLDEVAGALDKALDVPVVATPEAQIALARGAASSSGKPLLPACAEGGAFAVHTRALAVMGAVAVVSVFTLSAAGSPITLAESNAHQAAVPPTPEVDTRPASGAPVVPMVSPAPPAAIPPVPEEPAAPVAAAPQPVAPEVFSATAPVPSAGPPPVEHLPDPMPVEHLPGPPVAPGPVAPETPAPDPLLGAVP